MREEITEDTLLPLLQTECLGRVVHAFSVCDSTQTFARRLLDSGHEPAHGTLVVTDFQRSGYGRHARPWQVPAGSALLFSLIFYPDRWESGLSCAATMAAAVAVVRVLREEGLEGCVIKWPNDVLSADGRKLCGILTEQISCRPGGGSRRNEGGESPGRVGALNESGETSGRVRALITGVGLNVNQNEADFPDDIRGTAGSARIALGREVSRLGLLARVLREMENLLARPHAALFDAWQHYCATLGRRVRVRFADHVTVGHALALEDDGSLILRHDSGTMETVHSADVEELRTE